MRFTSIQNKLLVTFTGLFLCTFLIVHLVGNLQLLKHDEGLSFNRYAVFMTTNPLIKTVSYLLYASILLHVIQGVFLTFKNRQARKIAYTSYKGNTNSRWYSRSMGLLGTIILIFIVLHMANFWYSYKFGDPPYSVYNENLITGQMDRKDVPAPSNNQPVIHSKMEEFMVNEMRVTIVKDLNKGVVMAFKEEAWLVGVYVLSMIALSFHLLHGFQSAFQTLGIRNNIIFKTAKFLGIWVFAILIPAGFASIPLIIHFMSK